MEDVLELYHQPFDQYRPVVCFDEASKQLLKETRTPLPLQPGRARRFDYEYERNGTSNLFLFFEPLRGWRHIEVTDRRTMIDYAVRMRDLVDVYYPEAQCIRVVLDNLNTHKPASLYEAFAPSEARRVLDRLEFHYTPKHGSWLNMAEIELSVLANQCLDRRIADKETLKGEVRAWASNRNDRAASVNWRFTTADARIKLKRLYPSFDD